MNDGITLLLYYLTALRVLFNIIYGQYKPLIIKDHDVCGTSSLPAAGLCPKAV